MSEGGVHRQPSFNLNFKKWIGGAGGIFSKGCRVEVSSSKIVINFHVPLKPPDNENQLSGSRDPLLNDTQIDILLLLYKNYFAFQASRPVIPDDVI